MHRFKPLVLIFHFLKILEERNIPPPPPVWILVLSLLILEIYCGGSDHDSVWIVGFTPPINLYDTLGITHNERSQEKFGW